MPRPAVANPDTITVRVPMDLRRRGGRKVLVTPDGASAFAPARAQGDNALTRAIARAFRWRKLIEAGAYTTIREIAATEKINDSYVGRVLRLTLLAPDIVEAILDGQQLAELPMARLMKPLPVDWGKQRNAALSRAET